MPKGAGGAPIWPAGVVGSLAHDEEIAVAAVGLRRDFASIGIDVEPAGALPADMFALVATPRERRMIDDDPVKAKLLFAAKEAVYKAVYPLDRVFLEFGDIEIDLATGTATTRHGAQPHASLVRFIAYCGCRAGSGIARTASPFP